MSFQLRSMFTPGFLLTSFLTVAVTISACGPGQKTKTTTFPPAATSGQKLVGTQVGEDQPVTDESMEILGRDWAERPAAPSHRRVRTKTPRSKPFFDEGVEFEGPQTLPTLEQLEAVAPAAEVPTAAGDGSVPAPVEKVDATPVAPEESATIPVEPVIQPGAEPVTAPTPVVDPNATTTPVVVEKPVDPAAAPLPSVPLEPPVPAPAPPNAPVVQAPPEKQASRPTVAKPSTTTPVAQNGVKPQPEVPAVPVAPKAEKVAPLPQPQVVAPEEEVLAPVDPQLLKLDQSTRTVRARIFPHIVNETPFIASARPGEAHLSNDGGLILMDAQGNQIAQGKSAKFFFTKNLIKVGNQEFPLAHTVVVPRNEEHLTAVDDIQAFLSGKLRKAKHYRGKFVVSLVKNLAGANARWSVINYVDVEDYVISVVPQEIGNGKGTEEAIRAQAIAARTYVVYHLLRAREMKRDFDVETTTNYQVYGGEAGELAFDTPIVNSTEGQILVQELNGSVKVICSNFSANSGGHTCLPQECWQGGQARSYLLARRDVDGVRAVSGKGTRSGSIKTTNVSTVLNGLKVTKGENLTKVKSILVSERTESDRVKRITIEAQTATLESVTFHLTADETRLFLSRMGFPQRYLDFISSNGSEIKFYAYGYGHGIGMSQDGAIIQAKRGSSANQILAFYFANTRITTLGLARVR